MISTKQNVTNEDIFYILTSDLSRLAEKVDRLRLKINGNGSNGAENLMVDIEQSLQLTIDHFCIQEYEIERTLEKWLTLKRDLDLARLVQATIFPHEDLNFKHLTFSGFTKAARTLGGDYYTYAYSTNGVYAAIGDVSGKGVANALLTIILNNQIKQLIHQELPPEEILISLNQFFARLISDFIAIDNKFMTCLIFKYNGGDYIEYAGAGHEYMLIYQAETKSCQRIKTGGVALGLISEFLGSFSSGRVKLNAGDSMITYSDGITEARNEKNEMYGLNRLVDCVERNGDLSSRELIRAITTEVEQFQGTHEQYDDLTLMAIKHR